MNTFYHTSTEHTIKVESKNDWDYRFGNFLFFSAEVYTHGDYVHTIDIDSKDIFDIASIFYDDYDEYDVSILNKYVATVREEFNVNEDIARDLLDQTISTLDLVDDDDGELSWRIQHLQALLIVDLGFKAAEITDEQGTAYMIDMSDTTSVAAFTTD